MDEVKRKVYLDLFASPLTLLPVVGGATALLASWALGGVPVMTFGGVAAMVTGASLFVSRLIFGLDKLTENAYQYAQEQQQRSQLESLQQLHQRLEGDSDPRTGHLLRQLWTLYKQLKSDVDEGKIKVGAAEVLDRVNEMFHVCVDHLDRSYGLHMTANKMSGEARDRIRGQREELIAEVSQACDYLEQTINELNLVVTKKKSADLNRMREELDETIRVARLAEEKTDALVDGSKPYETTDFE